jgi:hypothetical protein
MRVTRGMRNTRAIAVRLLAVAALCARAQAYSFSTSYASSSWSEILSFRSVTAAPQRPPPQPTVKVLSLTHHTHTHTHTYTHTQGSHWKPIWTHSTHTNTHTHTSHTTYHTHRVPPRGRCLWPRASTWAPTCGPPARGSRRERALGARSTGARSRRERDRGASTGVGFGSSAASFAPSC